MTESDRLLLKLLSILLQYPDDSLPGGLADPGELLEPAPGDFAMARLAPGGTPAELIGRFLAHLRSGPLLCAQEIYTRTFDLSPATCLYLTWHRRADAKERGGDLARLVGVYRDGGYECVSRDLPDFLPMILEFASVCADDSGLELLRDFSPEIEKIRLKLKESQSPYAELFDLLAEAIATPRAEKERSEDELG